MALDPVAYYKLDESGGTRADSAGARNAAGVGGSVGSTAGVLNGAAAFDPATTGRLEVTDASVFSGGGGSFTWAGWAYLTARGGFPTILRRFGGSGGYMLQYDSGGFALGWRLRDSGGSFYSVYADFRAAADDPAEFWHFVCAEYDAADGEARIRINNGTPAVVSVPNVGDPGGSLYLGGDETGTGGNWRGYLDEWGFYTHLLTSGEQNTLYGGGTPPPYPFGPPAAGAVQAGGWW